MIRQEAKAATRRALLDAAERAFAERGYEATGIADIARTAGVATGTFYVHFASKEAALDELFAAFNARLSERLSGLLSARGRLADRVQTVAEAFLAECEAHRGLLGAYLERRSVHLDLTALRDGVNPPAFALLRAALGEVAVPQREIDLATHGLLALWMRVALQRMSQQKLSRAEAARVLARMTVGAVRALRAQKEKP